MWLESREQGGERREMAAEKYKAATCTGFHEKPW